MSASRDLTRLLPDRHISTTFLDGNFLSLFDIRLRRWTLLEGIFYALMLATAETFAILYAVANKVPAFELATLSTLPIMVGALGQWLMPMILGNRLIIQGLITSCVLQLLGLMSLSYITTLPFNFTSLLVSMSVFWFGGMSAGPLWQTIYARWLPSQHFRHFLARRNSVVVFYTLVFFLFFGVHLRSVPHVPFTLIFAISAAARLATILCFLYLNRFVKTSTGLHQRDFLSNERRAEPIHIGSLVIKLCIFSALYRFAMMMGNSFTAMYLIEDIKVDNGDFILLTALPMVGKTLFLDGWGQASFGFRPILGLKVSQVVLGIIPMLWILWDSVLGLSVSMFMNGLVLGGYDLCLSLAIHHLAMERRGRVLGSHLALMNALGVLGGWLGSYLFHRYSSITDVFWISACLRLAVSAMFIASIRKLDAVSFRANHYGEFITTAFSLRPTINKVESVITSASRIRGNEKVSS